MGRICKESSRKQRTTTKTILKKAQLVTAPTQKAGFRATQTHFVVAESSVLRMKFSGKNPAPFAKPQTVTTK